jgi:hypothetical protein
MLCELWFPEPEQSRSLLLSAFEALISQNFVEASSRLILVLNSLAGASLWFVSVLHNFSSAGAWFGRVSDERARVWHLSCVLFVNCIMNLL